MHVEKLVTRAKRGGLANRKLIISATSPKTAGILMDTLGPKYKSRPGGYTRVMKLGVRKSDAAAMAIIEFV